MSNEPIKSDNAARIKLSWITPRKRVSIKFLFVLTALCAALIGVWRNFIYEPPTHKVPGYEKATAVQNLSTSVGRNRIEIKSVARNRADGTVAAETGAGVPLLREIPASKLLSVCADWMDVAQIELQPGIEKVEIIEARIFDHATRILLSHLNPRAGWRVVNGNLIQVYAASSELPASLDVWLKVHSYDQATEMFRLEPTGGSTASIPGGTVTVSAIQSDYSGWNSASGFTPVAGDGDRQTGLVLTGAGSPHGYFQLAAHSKYGQKQFCDRLLDFGGQGDKNELVTFDFALEEIDHFELRPYGSHHRFFFEAVQMPQNLGSSRNLVGASGWCEVEFPAVEQDANTVVLELAKASGC